MTSPDESGRRLAGAGAAPAGRAGLVLLVMCAGMFLVLLDVTVVNVAVPAISAGLATGTAGVQAVVDGYAVALASLLLGGGIISDRIGHRRIVLAGLGMFGTASAGCALASSAGLLIVARAGQGAGAALFLPSSLAAIADAYPAAANRARALGIWAGVSSLALPAGPLLGGLIVQYLGWRAVFWINPPVTAACMAGVIFWARPSRARPDRRMDIAGVALATVVLTSAVYAVIAVGRGGTHLALAAGAAVIAMAAAAGFIRAERRAAAPVLPLPLLADRALRAVTAGALVMNLTSNGLLFLLTRYLQQILGHQPLAAGLMLLPLFIPLAALSPAAGRLAARYGPGRVMVTGAILAAAGQADLLAVTPAAGYLRLLPALLGVGIGLGLFTAPMVAAALAAVPPDKSGLASGINNTARQAGTALGVALYGALAGPPARAGRFTAALHGLGIVGAALWVIVGAALWVIVAGSEDRGRHPLATRPQDNGGARR
ncbi:MAG: MFS transporter [Streptosporangiaceae bacterium]